MINIYINFIKKIEGTGDKYKGKLNFFKKLFGKKGTPLIVLLNFLKNL
jgi:hypothetical protein